MKDLLSYILLIVTLALLLYVVRTTVPRAEENGAQKREAATLIWCNANDVYIDSEAIDKIYERLE